MNNMALNTVRKVYPRVKEVKDASESLVIHVTENDERIGHSLDRSECALAQACKRQLGANGAIIGIASSYIITGTTATRYKTSVSIAREIVSFDRHKDFRPGEYLLAAFSDSNRLGGRDREYASGKKQGGHGKPRKTVHLTIGVRGRED